MKGSWSNEWICGLEKNTCFCTEEAWVLIRLFILMNLMSEISASIYFFCFKGLNVLEKGLASMMIFYS
jgi:hypothetical protein